VTGKRFLVVSCVTTIITTLTVFCCGGVPESVAVTVTVTVTGNGPGPDGVPLITPVEEFNVKPAGKVPVTCQV
jgi:hypothetical protein